MLMDDHLSSKALSAEHQNIIGTILGLKKLKKHLQNRSMLALAPVEQA
jgi:hypothetical protein